jgi:Ca2+-binding EF-hand superfamily protein
MNKKIKLAAAFAVVSVMSLSGYNVAYGEDDGSDEINARHEQGNRKHKGRSFKKMDRNDDGKITKSEALENAEERFSKVDTNNDGSITRDEAKKHHKNRKKKGNKQ